MRVFRAHILICVCASFPFGFEGRMWDVIVLIPDHCLFTLVSVRGCLYYRQKPCLFVTDQVEVSFMQWTSVLYGF